MMNTIGGLGFVTLWALHILSVVAFFTGIALFIGLAIKTFNATQLRNWTIGLLIGGSVLCLYTIAQMGHPWTDGGFGMRKMPMQGMQMMMQSMMDHDKGANTDDRMEHEGMMNMMRMMMNMGGSTEMGNDMMQR